MTIFAPKIKFRKRKMMMVIGFKKLEITIKSLIHAIPNKTIPNKITYET